MIHVRDIPIFTVITVALIALTVVAPLVVSVEAQGPVERVRIVVGYSDEVSRGRAVEVVGVQPRKELKEIRALVFEVPKHAAEVLLSKLRQIPGIRYAEYDVETKAVGISDSPDVRWNMKIINITGVWDYYYRYFGSYVFGRGVLVAVLDTGVDYTHPDLQGRVVYCINTIGSTMYRGTNLRNCMDRNGHGTHVAGIIAATINGVGVAGVAPNVSIVAVKVLTDSGTGTVSDIAEGVIEAVKVGARILSMSLGSSSDSSVLRDATYWAYQQGAILVVAAGNSGDGNPSTNNVNYPAKYSWVIAVAAVDSNYNVPSWSSDGPEVDIAAPGVNILSTYPGGRYAYLSGTSMATPHVTGVVAVIQALRVAAGKQPLTFEQMYRVLTYTAIDIGPSGFDVYTGYGLVNAWNAVQYALSLP